MTSQERLDLRERLAASEHERWSHWMQYLFSRCARREDGAYIIAPHDVTWWEQLIVTPYKDLTERSKNSDRKVADEVLAILSATCEDVEGPGND